MQDAALSRNEMKRNNDEELLITKMLGAYMAGSPFLGEKRRERETLDPIK
jgi:hypothetical protein